MFMINLKNCIIQFIIIILLFFIVFFYSSRKLQKIYFPKPTGKYSVGTKSIEFIPNKIIGQLFYPTESDYPNQKLTYYMPGTLDDGLMKSKILSNDEIKIFSYAQENAKVKLLDNYSLIIFIPGFGEERQKYTILCEELASHGYIILSLDQVGVSNFIKFSDCILTPSLLHLYKITYDRSYRYGYFDKSIQKALENIDYVLSHIDFLQNRLDGGINIHYDKIILMGHSFGGNVVRIASSKYQNVSKVIDIDSKVSELPIYNIIGINNEDIKKPTLFIRGNLQYQEEFVKYISQIKKNPLVDIWQPNVEHSAFSDQCYLANTLVHYRASNIVNNVLAMIFKLGPFFNSIDTKIDTMSVTEWYRKYTQYILDYLS